MVARRSRSRSAISASDGGCACAAKAHVETRTTHPIATRRLTIQVYSYRAIPMLPQVPAREGCEPLSGATTCYFNTVEHRPPFKRSTNLTPGSDRDGLAIGGAERDFSSRRGGPRSVPDRLHDDHSIRIGYDESIFTDPCRVRR